MSQVLGAPSRAVFYMPSLATVLHRLRAKSALFPSVISVATPSAVGQQPVLVDPAQHYKDALAAPELTAARLHPHFAFPGSVGLHLEPPITAAPLPTPSSSSPVGTVECLVQECPKKFHDGFMTLFRDIAVEPGSLTVVTLSEKTTNDMTGWSPLVQEEREALLEHFIGIAKEVCGNLKAAGYWADFIDPSSGRAFYSPHSNSILLETDERFRKLGFDILDLGCCKCINHPLWGSHAFVGSIFTNAPMNSRELQSIVQL